MTVKLTIFKLLIVVACILLADESEAAPGMAGFAEMAEEDDIDDSSKQVNSLLADVNNFVQETIERDVLQQETDLFQQFDMKLDPYSETTYAHSNPLTEPEATDQINDEIDVVTDSDSESDSGKYATDGIDEILSVYKEDVVKDTVVLLDRTENNLRELNSEFNDGYSDPNGFLASDDDYKDWYEENETFQNYKMENRNSLEDEDVLDRTEDNLQEPNSEYNDGYSDQNGFVASDDDYTDWYKENDIFQNDDMGNGNSLEDEDVLDRREGNLKGLDSEFNDSYIDTNGFLASDDDYTDWYEDNDMENGNSLEDDVLDRTEDNLQELDSEFNSDCTDLNTNDFLASIYDNDSDKQEKNENFQDEEIENGNSFDDRLTDFDLSFHSAASVEPSTNGQPQKNDPDSKLNDIEPEMNLINDMRTISEEIVGQKMKTEGSLSMPDDYAGQMKGESGMEYVHGGNDNASKSSSTRSGSEFNHLWLGVVGWFL